MLTLRLAALLAAGGVALGGSPAVSASLPCSDASFAPVDVTGFVSPILAAPSGGCEIDPAVDNDSPRPDFLAANWFGSDEWKFGAKTNEDSAGGIEEIDELGSDGLNELDLSITGDSISGSWSISGATGPVMLVLKGGAQKLPNALVAYLLAGSSGSYTSPFFTRESDYPDSPSEISHISVWYQGDPGVNLDEVPLPAAAPMLIGGLAVLGFLGWRRRAA